MLPGEVFYDDRGAPFWRRPDGAVVPLAAQGLRTDWARAILRRVLVDRDRLSPGVVQQACLGLGLPYVPARRGRR